MSAGILLKRKYIFTLTLKKGEHKKLSIARKNKTRIECANIKYGLHKKM